MLRFLLTCVLSLICVAPIFAASETKTPGNVQRGFEILQKVRRESKDKDYSTRTLLSAELVPYDVDLALKLAADEGAASDLEVSFIIVRLAQNDPERAAELAVPLLKKMRDAKARLQATILIGPQLAKIAPDLTTQILQQFDALPKPGSLDTQGIFLQLYAGALEADPKAARARFQYALDEAKNLAALNEKGEVPSGLLSAVVEGIAVFDPEFGSEAALDLPVGESIRSLQRTVTAIAPKNLALAQRLLERIPIGLSAQELHDNALQPKSDVLNDDPDFAFGLAAKAIIPELGKTDPAAALALARRVSSPYYRGDALILAAPFQDENTARALYDEVGEVALADPTARYERIATLARYAAAAYEKYPSSGEKLFARTRQLVERRDQIDLDLSAASQDNANFAFYYARVDAKTSRAMLERDLKIFQDKNQATGQNLSAIALAMSAVDIERALEIARAMPEDYWRFDTQRKIAQYVLAPADVRRDLNFRRWGATDSWQPGTPTGW